MSAIKPSDGKAHHHAIMGVTHLQSALRALTRAGASKRCLDKVRLAIKSADGAVRHAHHRDQRSEDEDRFLLELEAERARLGG